MNKALGILLLILASTGCKENREKIDFFSTCSSLPANSIYKEINNALFRVKYPGDWTEVHYLPNGLDISSIKFADTLQRGFLLTVVLYQEIYLKKNPTISYYRFIKTTYSNLEAVFLTRNDLFPQESDNTVYWRSELRILNKAKSHICYLVMGRRHNESQEPEWCDFKEIVESLKII